MPNIFPTGAATNTSSSFKIVATDRTSYITSVDPYLARREHEHELNPEIASYMDGLIASECKTCGERFTVEWFPGGTAVIRAQTAIDRILDLLECKKEFTEYAIREFVEAAACLKEDQEAIQSVLDSLELVKRAIAHDLLDE